MFLYALAISDETYLIYRNLAILAGASTILPRHIVRHSYMVVETEAVDVLAITTTFAHMDSELFHETYKFTHAEDTMQFSLIKKK